MTGKEVFQIWAPTGAKWADWVRPVLFVACDQSNPPNTAANFTIPEIYYLNELENHTAVFLDLPSHAGVKEGLALAALGWRPIPLYNGVNGQRGAMALVNNQAIESALIQGADKLKELTIAPDAPPAFLLDSNRTNRSRISVSVFDNSWDLYSQDIPSAKYFLENGITRIMVRGQAIQKDLAKILYEFQKKGLTILFTNGYEKAKEVSVKKPPEKTLSLRNLLAKIDGSY